MAVPNKPTLIIIHGAWHVPENYAKLTRALESQGYEVHVPRLPSVNGARPPNSDLTTDTHLIRSYVESLVRAGRTVLAIMHSYGGMVGTNALHDLGVSARQALGLRGGVSHLIYMAAYAVPEGTAMIDKITEFGHKDYLPFTVNFAEDQTCVFRDLKGLVGPGPEEKDIEEYLGLLVRWNGKCIYQATEHAAWREIPVSYIHTTLDTTAPYDYQKSFVEVLEKNGCKVQTFELETCHCPHFTATEGVVDIINQVIE
ncbi:hypothetical protein ABKA04_000244 [Annulohypoxylon sp. FPYF3050]